MRILANKMYLDGSLQITDRFPHFQEQCSNKASDFINIDYKSPNGKLTLRLTTQQREITVGFTPDIKFNWHTHMSSHGANTLDEEIAEAITLIDSILNDKAIIVHSTVLGYFIVDDIEGVDKYKQEGEIIQTFYWSDL